MKLFIFLCLSQALLCTLVCGHHGGPHDDDDHDHHHNETETFLQLTTANVKFSYKIFNHLAATYPNDNLFFSPLGISIAFSLISLGAKSKTLHQIQEGFSFNTSLISEQAIHKGFQKLLNIINQPKSGLHLNSANALFIDNKLKILDKFLEDAKKFYQSEAISTDFQKAQEALEQINSHVEKKTDGKIKDLLDNLDPLTDLVIVNAILFKGSWEHAFNVDFTKEEDFHVDENTVVKVPMMHRRGEYLTGYISEIEGTAVIVPYNGNTSAVFVLPKKGKLLRDAEKAIENVTEEAWNNAMKPRNMKVCLPLRVALLFTLAFADHHEGDHHDKDDHYVQKDAHHNKGGHHGNEHHNQHNESMPCHKISPYNSKFSFDLYRQVALDHPSENIVFSPVGISTAFAFLSMGAKSQTHSQIIEGIGFNTSEISEQEIHEGFHHLLVLLNDVNRELQLSGGNALFISQEYKILQTFLDDAKKLYHSEAFSTDFENEEEATNQINSYAEKNTHGKITKLLDNVNKDSIFVLINYIYFKAKWEDPFENEYTEERDFHVSENKTVKVPFMRRTGFYLAAITNEATVISIPYKGDAGALFILPEQGKLSELEQNLNTYSIIKWKNSLRTRFVDLELPKFSITGTIDLKETLGKMGIVDVFSDKADLSGITEEANVKISKAVHKAVLNVNEQGTEAAAVTEIEGTFMRLPILVKYDHPFIFTLYDLKAKSVLFSGRVFNPQG